MDNVNPCTMDNGTQRAMVDKGQRDTMDNDKQ